MDKKIKDWGIFGFIVYILSLPIMFWKSSKIGRIVFVWLFIIISVYGLNKLLDIGSIIYAKFQIQQNIAPIKKDCAILTERMQKIKLAIEEYNNSLSNRLNEKMQEIDSAYNRRYNEVDSKIIEVEKSLDVIREEERSQLKDKIYELRQRIKIEKQPIDKKENRKLCEEIASHTFLLTKDEQDRLLKGLEDLGYAIEETQGGIRSIVAYNPNGNQIYSCVSASVVTMNGFRRWEEN